MSKTDGGAAFPRQKGDEYDAQDGMSLRDWFAGQAMANSAICTGTATQYELKQWFGDRVNITRAEIVAAQAHELSAAMLAERDK